MPSLTCRVRLTVTASLLLATALVFNSWLTFVALDGQYAEAVADEYRLVARSLQRDVETSVRFHSGLGSMTDTEGPLEETLNEATGVGERFNHPLRHKVSLQESLRDCVLLPPPTRCEFDVALPEGSPTLDCALAVRGQEPGESVRFRFSIGDSLLLDETLSVRPPDWSSGYVGRSIDLTQWAGEMFPLAGPSVYVTAKEVSTPGRP